MKKEVHGSDMNPAPKGNPTAARLGNGPSLYELEYLNQVVSELKLFLESRSVTTMKNIYVCFEGNEYSGKMMLSNGA